MFATLTNLKHTSIHLLCSGLRICAMTAKSLLNEFHQHYPLWHTEGASTEEWQDGPYCEQTPRMLCLPSLHTPGLRPEDRHPKTHLITVQRVNERSPIKGGMGVCTWLSVAPLEITAQTAPSSSSFSHSIKIPSIIPHCIPNQPRPYGEKTGILYKHGKKRKGTPSSTTFSTRDASWKN